MEVLTGKEGNPIQNHIHSNHLNTFYKESAKKEKKSSLIMAGFA